eukprot:UN05674
MLKNVFKGKKKDKDKKSKNKVKKSSSMDDYNAKKHRKLKDQTSNNKSKRSQTNSHDMENLSPSKKKKKKSHSPSKKKKKKAHSSSTSQLKDNIYQLNDYISLKNKRKGLIRYIGNVHFGNGEWFGIELMDGTIGNHDGKVGNKRYFKTASKCGIFVTHDQIKKLLKKPNQCHSLQQKLQQLQQFIACIPCITLI